MPRFPRVLLALSCLLAPWLCTRASAQNLPEISLTAEYRNQPLQEVIGDLQRDFDLTFSYLDSLVANRTVSQSFSAAGWEEVSDLLFERTGLDVKIMEGGYVILSAQAPDANRNWDICARVVDENDSPLPFVTIGLPRTGEAFYTGEDGGFRQNISASARDSASINFLGYQPMTVAIADLAAEECRTFKLRPGGIDLTSIVVTEYLTDGIESTVEGRRIVIRPDAVAAVPGFTENEIYRIVQMLPGVNSPDETAGSLNIRGGNRDQTQVLWDGINIYAPGHYLGMISYFSPELVDRVDVWRGQADASYGGRLSGVVRMETDRGIVAKPEAGANLNLTHGGSYLKIPVVKGKSDIHLAGRSSIGAFLGGPTYESYQRQFFEGSSAQAFIDPEAGSVDSLLSGLDEDDFRFREINGRWQFNPTGSTQFTLSGFSQSDVFNSTLAARDASDGFVIESRIDQNFDLKNAGLAFHGRHQFKNGHALQFATRFSDFSSETVQRLSFNVFSLTFPTESEVATIERSSTLDDFSAKLGYELSLAPNQDLALGLEYQRMNSTWGFAQKAESDIILDPQDSVRFDTLNSSNSFVGFATYQLGGEGPFSASLGLRLNYNDLVEQLFLEPRLTANYRVNDGFHLKAGYGHNHQFFGEALELAPDEPGGFSALWVLANGDDIPVASARELTLGGIYNQRSWLVDLEFYYKTIEDLPTLSQFGGGDGAPFLGSASRTLGMDLLVKKRWKDFRSWVIYSLSDSNLSFDGDEGTFVPAANDRPHQLQWVNSYESDRWLFSLGWRFASGRPFSDFAESLVVCQCLKWWQAAGRFLSLTRRSTRSLAVAV